MPTWPQDTIQTLLTLADAEGHSRAKCKNETDAGRFRFAIYNYRRNHKAYPGIEVTVEGSDVVLTKTIPAEVTIA